VVDHRGTGARLRIECLSNDPRLIRIAPPPPAFNRDDLSQRLAPRSPPIATSKTLLSQASLARCPSPSGYAAKDEQVPAVRITPQRLLNQEREAIESLAHVGVAGRKPNSRSARHRDHRRRLPFARSAKPILAWVGLPTQSNIARMATTWLARVIEDFDLLRLGLQRALSYQAA
jgi:hypothetical protein